MLAYAVLIQQVSHTSVCTYTVANRAGNPKTRPWHASTKKEEKERGGKRRKRGNLSSWPCSSCFFSLVFGIQAIQNPHCSLQISFHNICGYTRRNTTRWEVLAILIGGLEDSTTAKANLPTFSNYNVNLHSLTTTRSKTGTTNSEKYLFVKWT